MNSNEDKSLKKFLIVWFGQLISSIGSGLTAFALGIYVFELTHSASSYSLIILFGFLPSFILRPLGGTLSDTEYVKIIQELVQAEMDQENYLEALNILEGVPQSRLSQKDSCEVLIWQSIVLRAIDAAPRQRH